MANIELVIKISEKEYINIKNAINSLIENGVERASMSKVCLAILNGTPLPKRHGRLIDVDELLISERPNGFEDDVWKESHIYKLLSNASTIIEADKEREDTE